MDAKYFEHTSASALKALAVDFARKLLIFSIPVYLMPLLTWFPLEFCIAGRIQKN